MRTTFANHLILSLHCNVFCHFELNSTKKYKNGTLSTYQRQTIQTALRWWGESGRRFMLAGKWRFFHFKCCYQACKCSAKRTHEIHIILKCRAATPFVNNRPFLHNQTSDDGWKPRLSVESDEFSLTCQLCVFQHRWPW